MSSQYPGGFDSVFPGYPYVDFTENVTASQANAWVAAIQALETTVGFGTAGTSANPLFSQAYATTYSTVTARIGQLETNVVNGLKLNTAAGNIQSVGLTNAAGSSGLAADASHVHAGPASSSLKQIGEVFMWPGSAATFPANCLQCNGQGISTSTYAALFSIIAYNYGGGGATFNLPNYNDRRPVGIGTLAPSIGSSGGSNTISVSNLPAHNHPVSATDSGHVHASRLQDSDGGVTAQAIYLAPGSMLSIATTNFVPPLSQPVSWSPGSPIDPGHQNSWAPATANISASSGNTGGGSNFNEPYLGTYFLIKAL